MAEDLSFAFDTSSFEAGLKKIGNGISGFQKSVGNMAKSVSKGIMNAVAKIGLVALAFKGVQGVLKGMPEVGQAFGIAKDIFMKNLLWPLRKAVFPWLQKLVDWVRTNRGMFVKWGATLANIFNTIVSSVQKVIDIGQKMVSTFIGFINRVFGTSIRDLQELLNVLTFKFSVVITFLSTMLEPLLEALSPVIDLIATGLGGAFETATSFVTGFIEGIDGIDKAISGIVSSLQMIVDNLFTANEQGHSLQTVFEEVGRIFGEIVNWVAQITDAFLAGLAPVLSQIMTPLQEIVDAFGDIIDMLFTSEGALNTWRDVFGFLGTVIGTTIKVAFEAIAGAIGIIRDGIQALMDFFESEGFQTFINGVGSVIDALGGFFGGIGDVVGGLFENPMEGMIRQLIEQRGEEEAYNILVEKNTPEDLMRKYFPERVDDAIITKDGRVIRTNPEDMIIATQGGLIPGGGSGQNITVTVDFTGMTLQIQDATQEQAEIFSETIVNQIRTQLQNELTRVGAQ